jgi:hypothetical protein
MTVVALGIHPQQLYSQQILHGFTGTTVPCLQGNADLQTEYVVSTSDTTLIDRSIRIIWLFNKIRLKNELI